MYVHLPRGSLPKYFRVCQINVKGKGKVIPLQGRCNPEGG